MDVRLNIVECVCVCVCVCAYLHRGAVDSLAQN